MRTDIALRDGWEIFRLAQLDGDHSSLLDGSLPDQAEPYRTSIPAQVHDVLLDRGLIPDPRIGKNAADCAWVGDEDWAYRCSFSTPDVPGRAWLTFYGVDTVADAYLNGHRITGFGNMFREYTVDVTLRPRGAENVLVVVLRSPSHAVDEVEQPADEVGRIRKEWYVRKGAGDWASYLGARPRFLTVGLHRDVVLSVAGSAWLRDVRVNTVSLQDARAVIQIDAAFGGEPDGQLNWTVTDPDGAVVVTGRAIAADGPVEVEIADPRRWWPRSHGPSPLYTVDIQLLDRAGAVLDSASRAIGLREIELQREDPETGEPRFRFVINGVPVFLRGSCWAPVEGSTHCWKPDRAARLLDLVEHGDMNAVRVWGGGLLPEDDFYDECDRRGILLWQDFMFEYSMYPTGPAFDENYRAEAEGMVRRLRNHPSIIAWVGGNEGHMGWNFAHGNEPAPGVELFEKLLPDVCDALDGTRPYHASSPFGGPVANWPLEGDWHDYTTLTYSHRASVPAFASELGRVSAPALRSMRRFLSDDELWPPGHDGSIRSPGEASWPQMWGYRSVDGAWDKIASIEDYCEPTDAAGLIRALGTAHGEYLRERVERHRRGRPDGDRTPGRRCWGNLTWRLNDAWPILYWSAVDYYLEPKIPYYFLRRAYAPVLLSFEETADELAVWIVNDTADPVSGTLQVERRTFAGAVTGRLADQITVAPGESRRVLETVGLGPISLRTEFLHATFGDLDSTWLLKEERYLHLPPAMLTVEPDGDGITVSSDAFARQVTIDRSAELDDALVEENYFDLAPGIDRRIGILGGSGTITVTALNALPVTLDLAAR